MDLCRIRQPSRHRRRLIQVDLHGVKEQCCLFRAHIIHWHLVALGLIKPIASRVAQVE